MREPLLGRHPLHLALWAGRTSGVKAAPRDRDAATVRLPFGPLPPGRSLRSLIGRGRWRRSGALLDATRRVRSCRRRRRRRAGGLLEAIGPGHAVDRWRPRWNTHLRERGALPARRPAGLVHNEDRGSWLGGRALGVPARGPCRAGAPRPGRTRPPLLARRSVGRCLRLLPRRARGCSARSGPPVGSRPDPRAGGAEGVGCLLGAGP